MNSITCVTSGAGTAYPSVFFLGLCWSILGFSVVYSISLCVLLFLFSLTIVLSVLWVLITTFSIFKLFLRRILCSQNNIHCILIDIQTREPIRGHRDYMVIRFTTTYAIRERCITVCDKVLSVVFSGSSGFLHQ